MGRVLALLMALFFASMAGAQEFVALARIDPAASSLREDTRGRVGLSLALSQGVPWRVFQLQDPYRVVIDFREVDWFGFSADTLGKAGPVSDLRFGGFLPGWSRMVLVLDGPMGVESAGMTVDAITGNAALNVMLAPVGKDDFAALAGAPHDPFWDLPNGLAPPEPASPWDGITVMIDPGHGGIDPGAERDGLSEKDLMLTFARELSDTLRRAGNIKVVLTRLDDVFVSLESRVALAHEARADVFLSLHADALQQGGASGATIYVLSDEASDAASRSLAERHDRDNLLSGVDLTDMDDEVTDILLDLARLETAPRAQSLGHALVKGLRGQEIKMHRKPLKSAGFSVLKAADIPSVLVELGYMSSQHDLDNLRNPNWRASFAAGLRDGLLAWDIDDRARRDLMRQ